MHNGIVRRERLLPHRREGFRRGLRGGDLCTGFQHLKEVLIRAGDALKILRAVYDERHGQKINAQLFRFLAGDAAVCIGNNCNFAH